MIRRLLLILISTLIANLVQSQVVLSGIIKDAANYEILPFVNIGLRGGNIGTISNEKGEFTLTIPEKHIGDTLGFSAVGYEDMNIPIGYRAIGEVRLIPKVNDLKEVHILGSRLVERKHGLANYHPLLHFLDGSVNQDDIFEIAQCVDLGRQLCKVTSINLHINVKRSDSGIFRINFYNYDGRRPTTKIAHEQIIQKHCIKEGWLNLDVSSYNIYLKGDIVAGIEFIPTGRKSDPIIYEIKPGGRVKSFVRTSSLGVWNVPPHQYRMYVTTLGGSDWDVPEEVEEIEASGTFTVFSRLVKDSFSIFIRLPKSYGIIPDRKYPVAYVLDANLYFSYLADSLRKMDADETLLVGIGYKDFYSMDSLRNRDYTYPTALVEDEFVISGGANAFYDFIIRELTPHLDSTYSIDGSKRSLMGHSLGGYFVLYALYRELTEETAFFRKYVSTSPSVEYHNQYIIKKFKTLECVNSPVERVLNLSYGGAEASEEAPILYGELMHRLMNELSKDDLKRILRLACIVIPDAGHMEAALPGFYYGFESE